MTDNDYLWLAVACVFALVASELICRFALSLGTRFRLMDEPVEDRKIHTRPTPLVGGLVLLAVFVPILPMIMVLYEPPGTGNRTMTIVAVCTLVCAMLGMADDRHSLSARVRLWATVLLFASAIALDPRFLIGAFYFTGMAPIVLPFWAAWVFTLLVMIGFLNAVNMADGKNGLVISMSLYWALALSLAGPQGLVIIMLPLAVMLFVLLAHNMFSRLFLGDGGAYGLACLFVMLSVLSYNVTPGALTADMMTLFFIIPGIDMVRLFVQRIAKGRSPTQGDRDHLHHYIYAMVGWPFGLIIYLTLMAVPGLIAISDPALAPYALAASLIAYAAILLAAGLGRNRAQMAAQD
ncbi:MAG: undecaprenyl-phosphate alpha-N-acetylglucosaminyl 1-phosphate transferase [Pseudomonadota bacterium]